MSEKRDDMSHWGWDILGVVIVIVFVCIDYDILIRDTPTHYYRRGFEQLERLMDFLVGKKMVYTFYALMGSGFLFSAIVKIKKISLETLKGIRRALWIIVRFAFLVTIFFWLKYNLTNNMSLHHNYDVVIGLSVLPLVAWIALAKTKFSIWHFFVIMIYVAMTYGFCLNRIVKEELHNKHIKTIGIIDSVKVGEMDIFFIYNYDGHNGFFKHKVTGEKSLKYARLTRGDTITLIYLPRHTRINNIVNLFPTSKEIEEYKKSE